MTRFSDAELQRMRFDLESDLVERKPSASDRSSIRRNICALANDLPGHGRPGVILIGVNDDGSCASLEITDELLRKLADMRDDGNILPIPSIIVEKRVLGDCAVAVVIVEPSATPPVRYQGRTWVKVGPTTWLATLQEEQRLAERRRAADLPFDMRPASQAALEELDLEYIQRQYLPCAIPADILRQNERPSEQQLCALRLASGGRPTWRALLAFARDPQRWLPGAYVQFLRSEGNTLTDPVRDQKQLTGRLEDVLRQLEELMELSISLRTQVGGVSRELRRPDYPLDALRQLTRNAIMHRSYEGTNAPVRVYWYADRVEIHNPGGLYGQVTPENFGQGATDYRNPLVAEIMQHLGYAQRFGMGIPVARKALRDNGNPEPNFKFEPTFVAVTVRAAQ